MQEYWRDVNEHNKELAVQNSHNSRRFHEIGIESVGRSLEILNEQNEVTYENINKDAERNSEKYEDIHEDSGKRSQLNNYGGKRQTLSQCINEWILFSFSSNTYLLGPSFATWESTGHHNITLVYDACVWGFSRSVLGDVNIESGQPAF